MGMKNIAREMTLCNRQAFLDPGFSMTFLKILPGHVFSVVEDVKQYYLFPSHLLEPYSVQNVGAA